MPVYKGKSDSNICHTLCATEIEGSGGENVFSLSETSTQASSLAVLCL